MRSFSISIPSFSKICIIALSLLSIIHISYTYSVFTKDARIDHVLTPLRLNDKPLFTYYKSNSTIITSFEPGYEECEIPALLPANRWTLGNGKIVAITLMVTHFTIFDYQNCSSYSVLPIDNGEPYKYDHDGETFLVVPYYDTFDIFDAYRETCKPCRRNDKGESVQFGHKLFPEAKYYVDYFVESFNNTFGVREGYLYGFSFQDYTTIMKVLDVNYNPIKSRNIDRAIVGHSVLHNRATICHIQKRSGRTACETLDSDLKTKMTFRVKQPYKHPDMAEFRVTNLATGGAMIAIEYIYFSISGDSTNEIYIQQIYDNGIVEPAIHVGSFTYHFVNIHSFMTNSGEYCLVTTIENRGKGDHSLLKCVIPKA